MKKLNNSQGKPYYTQRNNALAPNAACNVTSMIAALSAAGWPVSRLSTKKFPQPEDALMDFIRRDVRVNVQWRELDPNGAYPPNEWHAVLALGTNLFLQENGLLPRGMSAVLFSEGRTTEEIIRCIDSGGAAVMSGVFRARGRMTIGHVVAVVGYSKDGDGAESFILDDSWGDFRTEYEDVRGNDIEMTLDEYMEHLRPCRNKFKMAHLVKCYSEFNK